MVETKQNSSVESNTCIRIVRINAYKTRRVTGWEVEYQIYFELSTIPPQGWSNIFEQQWKALSAGQRLSVPETSIESARLVIHCPIQEVAEHLPILKKAVASANLAYDQYSLKRSAELKDRENVWKDERKIVEDVANTLRFD